MFYIFIENEKLNGAGQVECLNEDVINFEVTEELYNAFIEAPEKYIWDGEGVVENPNYEQEQAKKEAERIAMLNLTRGDVFRGLLLAKGITKNQIAQMIEAMPVSTQEEVVTKELALIDFEDALNFYRGNQLIDTIGLALGITSKQLDNFFDAGTSDDTEIKANAYKYLTTVTLTINPTPVDAVVTINNVQGSTMSIPYGTIAAYKIEKGGYLTHLDTVELTEDTSIDIELIEDVTEPGTPEEPETPVEDTENEAENENSTDTES